MTGRRVLATLGCILLATAVLPPAAAWGVNRSRVRFAAVEVVRIAETLRGAEPELRDLSRGVKVLYGPGRPPLAPTPAAQPWVTMPRAALVSAVGVRRTLSPDPWGNCYVVKLAAIAAGEPANVWVLSAGPNGIIDTPFVVASGTPAGDDVGATVR